MIGKNKIKICLVGAGRMGDRWAEIISSVKGVVLSSVIDKNEAVGLALAKKYGARYFKSAATFSQSDADAVFVVTPHKFLYPLASQALKANKHVFVEKPGSRTAEEMKKLVTLAKKKGKKLAVGFNYRFFDAVDRAKNIVDGGKIGRVIFLRLRHGHAGRPGYEKEWRMDKNMSGGGVLMDQGVHLLDLVNWFFGSPMKKATGILESLFWPATTEDNAFVVLESEKKQVASMHVSITEWKPIFSLEISGTKGYCKVDGLGKKYGGKEVLTVGVFNGSETKEKVINCRPDLERCLNLEFVEFIKFISGKKNKMPTGEDALKVLNTVKKLYGKY